MIEVYSAGWPVRRPIWSSGLGAFQAPQPLGLAESCPGRHCESIPVSQGSGVSGFVQSGDQELGVGCPHGRTMVLCVSHITCRHRVLSRNSSFQPSQSLYVFLTIWVRTGLGVPIS